MKQTVYAVSTTEKDKWRGQEIHAAQGTGQADILVTGEKLQTIRGFGGCFNEMGYSALMDLPEADREHVIRELFSEEGCNFTYCRMPIGASDFAESWYSLNETENDFSMEHFTIERDKKCLIPYIQ
ncbi:MAG TPA: glycosyl hydrolase, partial [Firmicutes bacterium]|nr:glycosyl hydrolase [Bacillota bacterium]